MVAVNAATLDGKGSMLAEAAVEEFKKSLRGQLIAPAAESYDEARQVWNANVDRRPGLICRPTGVADVISAVTFARDRNLLVSVRGGAHNVAGTGVCNGGLVIDMSLMKGIRVDPIRCVVRAEGGSSGVS
jgi:FAD/FMN-containing dehydrogenase